MTVRTCANCARTLSRLEPSYSYLGRILCQTCRTACDKQLQDLTGTGSDAEIEAPNTNERIELGTNTIVEVSITEWMSEATPSNETLPQREDLPDSPFAKTTLAGDAQKEKPSIPPARRRVLSFWVGLVILIAFFSATLALGIYQNLRDSLKRQAAMERQLSLMKKELEVLRQAATNTVQAESPAEKILAGFMTAKEPMTRSQVESIYPLGLKFTPDTLTFFAKVFGRWAYVKLTFHDSVLVTTNITFKNTFSGEATEETYRQNQFLIEEQYGVFPEPTRTSEFILSSKKRIAKILIVHVLTKDSFGTIVEQVRFQRDREDE